MSPARRGHPGRADGTDLFFADDTFWELLDAHNIAPTGQWVHWHAVRWCARNGTTNRLPEPALAQICDGLQPEWCAELVAADIWHLEAADSGLPYYVLAGADQTRWYPDTASFLADPGATSSWAE